MHIAGSTLGLSALQCELVEQTAALGRERLAPRAVVHDAEASFPLDNMADLRAAGLLAICVPREHGGLGGDLTAFALVAAELGRHCGATALSYTMHVCATLWAGPVADALPMSPAQRASHEAHRRWLYGRIVEHGELFSQPFSEGGAAAAGKAPWGTLARRVPGGYVVNGRKIFASLAGVAHHHGVMCTLDQPGATLQDALHLAVAADAPGVSVCGEWDALGMRATASRTLVFTDVFVPEHARLLPEGLAWQAAQRHPYLLAAHGPTYLGLAQAAYDFTVRYLRAELPGMPSVKRRMYPTKQMAVAQMRIQLEQTRALFLQSLREAGPDPDEDARLRLFAMHHTVMENAQAIAALAIRTCGGQSLLKSQPLERIFRDARCGALMLPWTAELCLDRLGRGCLYQPGEADEAIE